MTLPFVMPSIDRFFNSSKRVVAHYFWPFPLSIDNVADSLRRVRRVWDKLEMPIHERRALADVMVRAPLSILDATGRYVEIKRKWSAAIGFEVQLPQ